MRDRFPLLLVGGLVILGVIGANVIKGAKRGAFADRLSTWRSEPDGARALYLLLSQGNVPVSRNQTSLDVIEPSLNLVLLGVRFGAEEEKRERPSVLNTLLDGGVDDEGLTEEEKEEFNERGFNALRSPPIRKEETEKLLEHVRNGATVVYVPWGHSENALLKAVDVSLTKAEKRLDIRSLLPAQPTAYTLGVERVEARIHSFLDVPPGAVPLLVDRETEEIVAALVPYGQGRLIVLGAPELAMNSALTRADNAQLWLSLGRAVGGKVAFDEYHHGFTGERSIGEFAGRYGLQFAAGQLLLGVILWAAALRRFGRPKTPKEEKRVGATDALFATSRLYREGKHHGHAAIAISKELATELAAHAGLSPRAAPTDISAALDVRGRKDLAHALLDVNRAAHQAGSEHDVQGVARLAALARQKLHHHRQRTKR